jgi:hypothetical protein
MKAIQAISIAILSSAQPLSCSLGASLVQQPSRNIAGVDIVDTPIVQNALEHARKYADELTYKHLCEPGYWVLYSSKGIRN